MSQIAGANLFVPVLNNLRRIDMSCQFRSIDQHCCCMSAANLTQRKRVGSFEKDK